jgi:hypothetical protein
MSVKVFASAIAVDLSLFEPAGLIDGRRQSSSITISVTSLRLYCPSGGPFVFAHLSPSDTSPGPSSTPVPSIASMNHFPVSVTIQ